MGKMSRGLWRDLESNKFKKVSGADIPKDVKRVLKDGKYFQADAVLTAIPLGEARVEEIKPPSVELMQKNAFSGMLPVITNIQPVNMPIMIGL